MAGADLRAARRQTLGLHEAPFEFAGIDGTLLIIGAAAGALGVVLRHLVLRPVRPARAPRHASSADQTGCAPLYRASFAKWWFDDLNDLIFVRFGGWVARALWWFDVRVVDGTVNGIAALTQGAGRGIRQIQTGRVQNYALGIAAGLLVMAITYIFVVSR